MRCGNCSWGAVGVPLEIGAVGALAVLATLLRVPYRAEYAIEIAVVAAGVFLTPVVIGVPLFAVGFVLLFCPILVVLTRTAAVGLRRFKSL